MADKKITDFTAATVIAAGDYMEIETAAGNSRKVLAEHAGLAAGTSFPGSPSSGDVFYRTDRNIEYFYDGTRWLSTATYSIGTTAGAASATFSHLLANPWAGTYDIYVEKLVYLFVITSATTGSNYFTGQVFSQDATTPTNIGAGASGQSQTQNSYVATTQTPNVVVGSSTDAFGCTFTRVGSGVGFMCFSITFRLVG